MSIPGVIVRSGSLIAPGGDKGIPGSIGVDGEIGPQGENAYTLTSLDFTVPGIGLSADLTVDDSDWIAVGQMVYLADGKGVGEALALKVTAKNENVVTLYNPPVSGTAEIPLADASQDGLLRQVSGLTTDYVNGNNSCANLVNALTGAFLPLTGGTLTGNLAMSSKNISGVNNITATDVTASYVTASTRITCPTIYFRSDGWRLAFNGANGDLVYYDSNNHVKFYWYGPGAQLRSEGGLYVSAHSDVGNLQSRGYIQAVSYLSAGNNSGVVYCQQVNFNNSGWKFYWEPTTGDLIYYRYDNYALYYYYAVGNIFYCGCGFRTIGKSTHDIGIHTPQGCANSWSFHWNGTNCYVNVDMAIGWRQIDYVGSDARLKQDIAPSTFDCLATVNSLPIHQFRWKPTRKPEDSPIRDLGDKRTRKAKDGKTPLMRVGFIAQELYKVFPESVMKGDDGGADITQRFQWTVEATTMLATLTGAIQQLTAKVNILEARVAELEGSPV